MAHISILRVTKPGLISFFTAGPDKTVICGGNPIPYTIVAVAPDPTNQWTISGNHASDFGGSDTISVAYNTGVDAAVYSVTSAVNSGPNTIITVSALTPINSGETGDGLMWIQDVVLSASVGGSGPSYPIVGGNISGGPGVNYFTFNQLDLTTFFLPSKPMWVYSATANNGTYTVVSAAYTPTATAIATSSVNHLGTDPAIDATGGTYYFSLATNGGPPTEYSTGALAANADFDTVAAAMQFSWGLGTVVWDGANKFIFTTTLTGSGAAVQIIRPTITTPANDVFADIQTAQSLTFTTSYNVPNTKVTVSESIPAAVFDGRAEQPILGHTFYWEQLLAGEQTVDYQHSIIGTALPTGLPNTTETFSAIIEVDGTPYPINVQGQNAQTFGDLINEINSILTPIVAVASIEAKNITVRSVLTGPISSINITDFNLFVSTVGFYALSTPIAGSDPVTWKTPQNQLIARYTASIIEDRWFRFWIDKGKNDEAFDDIFVAQTPTDNFTASNAPKSYPEVTYPGTAVDVTTYDGLDAFRTSGSAYDARVPLVQMVPTVAFPTSGGGSGGVGPPYTFIYIKPPVSSLPDNNWRIIENYQVQESTGNGWTTVNTTTEASSWPAVTGRVYRALVKYKTLLKDENTQTNSDQLIEEYVPSRSVYASPVQKVPGSVGGSDRFADPQGTVFGTFLSNYNVIVRTLRTIDWTGFPELESTKQNYAVNSTVYGQFISNYNVIVRTLTTYDWTTYPELESDKQNYAVNSTKNGQFISNYNVVGGAQIGGG